MIFENRCSVLFQALDSCACKAIFRQWSCYGKIDWEELTKIKMCMYTVDLLGLNNMTTYKRVKPVTAGPLRTENALFILVCLRK